MRNRAFLVLALAIFSSTLGIGMVSPILPVIAKDLGATGAWLGLSFSAFAVSQGISTLLFGRLSDRWGRRVFIIGGFVVYGLSATGYALSTSFEMIIAFRFVAGFGTAAVFPIAMAYVGDMSPRGREGTFLGTFNIANFIGFGAGPLLGGVIRDALGAEAAFWTMAGLLFATALVVFLLLPTSPRFRAGADPRAVARREEDDGPEQAAPMRVLLRDRIVRALIVFNVAQSVAFGSAFGFLALFMEDRLGASAFMVGLVLAMRTWVNGAASPFWGRAADRLDRVRLVTIGLFCAAVATFLIPEAGSIWLVMGAFVVAGLSEGMAWPALTALTVDRGRIFGMGGLMGVSQTASAAGLLIGSIVGGEIAGATGLDMTFRFAGALMVLGAIAFALLTRGVPRTAALREPPRARPALPEPPGPAVVDAGSGGS